MYKRGKFIVIDGLGKSGKSSVNKFLQGVVPKESVLFTREPGGTLLADEIRRILMPGEIQLSPLTHTLLFFATRRAHIEEKIKTALENGQHVICDRFDSSTDAYNLWGEESHHLRWLFNTLREYVVTPDVRPNVYIILDVDPKVAMERHLATRKNSEQDKFDEKSIEFYERVRRGFLEFSTRHNSVVVDANCSLSELCNKVLKIVHQTLT